MPRKQKRFTSEKAILKEIDAVEARQISAFQIAEEREANLAKLAPGDHKNWARKQAGVARRSAERLTIKKTKLKNALSAFRTILLPLDGQEDTSVTL